MSMETNFNTCPECARLHDLVCQYEASMKEMVLACGSCMNWMEQVGRAKLSPSTRGILITDMGMCSASIFRARIALTKNPNPTTQRMAIKENNP
jgi:hypothetical protein